MSPHQEFVHRYTLRLKGLPDDQVASALRLIEFFGITLTPIADYWDSMDSVMTWVAWKPEDVF